MSFDLADGEANFSTRCDDRVLAALVIWSPMVMIEIGRDGAPKCSAKRVSLSMIRCVTSSNTSLPRVCDAKRLAKAGQAPTFGVRKPQPALAHLPLENLVLRYEVFDDPLLVAVDSAAVEREQEREGLGR